MKTETQKLIEANIIESFVMLCLESMNPDLFTVLIDEIVPRLEDARHIEIRKLPELVKTINEIH